MIKYRRYVKRAVYLILVSLLAFTSCKKDSNPTSPNDGTATVTYSGKVYHTVKIGTQTWLKENLDVGVMIDSMQNPNDNGTVEKYCYGNDTANCTKYGGLYQWNEAMAYDTTDGARGICPTGWHIPTLAEFLTLETEVGNDGNKLKREDQGSGSGVGTNISGFSALLAGYRYTSGDIYNLGRGAYFWISTEAGTTLAYSRLLWFNYNNILMYPNLKENGFSIRCIKD